MMLKVNRRGRCSTAANAWLEPVQIQHLCHSINASRQILCADLTCRRLAGQS